MEKKETILRNKLGQSVIAVLIDDELKGFIVKGTSIAEMVTHLTLQIILSDDFRERNRCKMIRTLFEVFPVKEE